MGGVRTAGDLVARVQMTRRLRLPEAKRYVAERLGCDVFDLSDPVKMLDIRRDLGLGGLSHQDVTTVEDAVALGAKFAIAERARRADPERRAVRAPRGGPPAARLTLWGRAAAPGPAAAHRLSWPREARHGGGAARAARCAPPPGRLFDVH